MRTLALAFLFCSSSVANAQFQYDYPIFCDNTRNLIESIMTEYKEKISWTGNHINDQSKYSLWVNERTGSWTLLKMNSEVACILGVVEDSQLFVEKI